VPNFTFSAEGKEYKGGALPAEAVSVTGPTMLAGTNDYAVMDARPVSAQLTLTRTLPGDGDLVLLRIAVDSQVWNNRQVPEGEKDNWPTGSVVLERKDGTATVPVQRTDLNRIVVTRWVLSWTGQGPARLAGATFTETLTLKAYRVIRTSLVGKNESVTVTLE
jgi:hypothetical protein